MGLSFGEHAENSKSTRLHEKGMAHRPTGVPLVRRTA